MGNDKNNNINEILLTTRRDTRNDTNSEIKVAAISRSCVSAGDNLKCTTCNQVGIQCFKNVSCQRLLH